ncbi:MAG TPA: hypothetical protein VIF09_20400 [Polyangiaceae bacterium]|jgi:DNA-3-methyladenine glycosylase II
MMSSQLAQQTGAVTRSGRIACVAPFDLAHSLAFLRGFGPMRGEQVVTDVSVTKALLHGGQPVVFTVWQHASSDHPVLDYRLTAERPLGDAAQQAVTERIAFFLGAEEDLAPFHALAEADPAFAPLARRLRGLHHVKFPTPFEAACWGAINQRIPRALALRMKCALTHHFGKRLVVEGHAHWAFPGPQALARVGEKELARLMGNERRARSVDAIARAFVAVDDEFLRRGPLDEVARWLRSIHGVGPFTTAFVLYRGLGRFRGQPMLAPPLVAAASTVYGRELSPAQFQRLAQGYGAWGGQWMLYLWASTFIDDLTASRT